VAKKAQAKKTTKKATRKKATASKSRARGRPKWADKFLVELRETRSVTKACDAVGISRGAPYHLRADCKEFAAQWEDALKSATSDLKATLFEIAKNGWVEDYEEYAVCQVSGVKSLTKIRRKNRKEIQLGMWLLQKYEPETFNLPQFVPVGDDGKPQGATAVMFINDPAEARRIAEKQKKEAAAS
jgi:hypothetical protein